MESEKDQHQEEIIAIQCSYKDRVNHKLDESEKENEALRNELNELRSKLANELPQLKNSESNIDLKISSNKSDDGWCINGK